MGQKRDYDFLKDIAFKYLHAPYQWGGKSPFGIDCSGFVQIIYKINGYLIPRDTSQQMSWGSEVSTIGNAMPGDLAFFSNRQGNVSHVGMILDDGKIIHASGRVRIDRLTEEGIIDVERKVITHSLTGFRRILTLH